jgi:hypothetical protein
MMLCAKTMSPSNHETLGISFEFLTPVIME